jgi:hypothetical protein
VNKASDPDDLAFLAMVHHKLGQKDQAQATLVRLQDVIRQSQWATNPQAQGFLREAEELLKTKPADNNK